MWTVTSNPSDTGLPDHGAAEKKAWAARYVSYGWALVPVIPYGKQPATHLLSEIYGDSRVRHLHDAPAFLKEVLYWLEWDPQIGLAVIPRATPGLVVVDIDKVELLNPDLRTPQVTTGREGGGRHLYFSSDTTIPRNKTIWGDVNPEYALLPPSGHESRRFYLWDEGCSPEDVPLMPFTDAAPLLGLEHLLESPE